MWFVVFFILFLVLILYLLLIPIIVNINTNQNQYEIRLHNIVKATIEEHEEELLRIKFKIFFFSFYFYPLKNIQKDKKSKSAKESTTKSRRKFSISKMMSILKSFKVRKVLIDIDTGDNVLNAKLYPFFGFLNYYLGTFNINFEGRNQLVLQIQNRPIHIIKSFINK